MQVLVMRPKTFEISCSEKEVHDSLSWSKIELSQSKKHYAKNFRYKYTESVLPIDEQIQQKFRALLSDSEGLGCLFIIYTATDYVIS